MAKLNAQNQAFYELLTAKRGKTITSKEILDVTGWTDSTWRTHWNKGVYSPFLTEQADGSYRVSNSDALNETAFQKRVTQKHQSRELGAQCKSPLARALLRKAKENITLALELYNRPSLENRLDGFCMLFCAAWEQLLKATLIERDGEQSIYRQVKPGRRHETLSLEECLARLFLETDPVRRNIGLIAEFRHEATHLLMREVQGVMSRIFQSGILNFARRFQQFANEPLFLSSSGGLLSLVCDFEDQPDVLSLRQMYGETVGNEIAALIEHISQEIRKTDDHTFAIPVEYRLRLTKKEMKGDITLVPADEAPVALKVVEKPVPVEHQFPHKATDAAKLVGEAIGKRFTNDMFLAVCHQEKWKSSNNEFHHEIKHPVKYRIYSQKAVDFVINKEKNDAGYIDRAVNSYHAAQRKKMRSRTGK